MFCVLVIGLLFEAGLEGQGGSMPVPRGALAVVAPGGAAPALVSRYALQVPSRVLLRDVGCRRRNVLEEPGDFGRVADRKGISLC